jgi:hypothetical protein
LALDPTELQSMPLKLMPAKVTTVGVATSTAVVAAAVGRRRSDVLL